MELLQTNSVKIVGKLVNADVKTGFDKSNNSYVSVNTTVVSEIEGKTNTFEVNFYAREMTKDNKVSQLYTNYVKLPELVGKKVEIDGSLRENRFWSTKGEQLVSSQLITGRFVKGVLDSVADKATYEIGGFVVRPLTEKKNKEGAIYRYDLSLGQANYSGDKMSVFTLHVDPSQPEIVRGARAYESGMTVLVQGNLNFVQETVTVVDENTGFGQPMAKTYTNTTKNYFITSGSNPYKNEQTYSSDVIRTLIDAYKANDVQLMSAAQSGQNSAVKEEAPAVSHRQASLI